ncbi:CHAD domain-containing protein [Humitalea sp. 24SJ18S-53]|uniref:CHAD domain-containing protein n=1 Tax=Humitalea sp. 24SJ18S-53 TaxID=3422307 RepID=UPI003D675D63
MPTRHPAVPPDADPPEDPAASDPREAPAAATFALELDLPPGRAGRLARHPAFAGRTGRARGSAETLIWLDTAEGALAADGLALEAPARGDRRMIHGLDRGAEPGAPPRVADIEAPPEPLVPIAAFDGRRMVWRLAGDVVATLRHGRLRSVAAEAEAARLLLEGPPTAVLALAHALAADLPLLPATVSLAEAARALAHNTAPRDRRRGAPVPTPDASLADALAAAIGHLTDVLLIQAPRAHDGTAVEGVHQMRVAARRLRSLLRVFRRAIDGPPLRRLDAGLRDVAGRLGPARDWDVFLGGIGAGLHEAAGTDKRVAALLRRAAAERDTAYTALRATLDGADWRHLTLDLVAAARLPDWRTEVADPTILDAPLPPFAAEVLARRWRGLKRAARDIETLSMTELHALRLDAKRVRYAAELLAPLWPERATKRFAKRLAALQEALGLANDATVARDLAMRLSTTAKGASKAVSPWAIGLLEGYALARAAGAREHAIAAWEDARSAPIYWKNPPIQ